MLITRASEVGEWRWPHFALDEFVCHCGATRAVRFDDCAEVVVNTELLDILEALRAELGNHPIRITSGYRCPRYNTLVGGVPHSQHLLGNAADIRVAQIAPDRVWRIASRLIGDRGGVGRYARFTHIDVRGHRARW